MSLFASIDVGSNTIRLLIGEFEDNRIADVYYGRKITRLGNGVNQTGQLLNTNIEASRAALREFASIISKHGVNHVRAVATSALRQAGNSKTFIEKVFADTGICIEVISGEKEAELTLKGILLSIPDSSAMGNYSLLITDIGGGSTEWILYREKHIIDMISMPIGVINLSERFLKNDPASEDDIHKLNKEFDSFLYDLDIRIGQQINRETQFIGTAGTFTTIASIDLGLDTYSREKIHLHKIPLNRLQNMSKKLLSLPLRERKKVKGLEPERADLIIPGIQFTIKAMEFFKFHELTISDYGLLEGAFLDIKREDEKNISKTCKP